MPESEMMTLILALASAVVLIVGAIEKITALVRGVRSPFTSTLERLESLERWREDVERKLERDHDRLAGIDESFSVTQRALLALLDHGIDGNNIDSMKAAKEELHNHLTGANKGYGR